MSDEYVIQEDAPPDPAPAWRPIFADNAPRVIIPAERYQELCDKASAWEMAKQLGMVSTKGARTVAERLAALQPPNKDATNQASDV